MACKNCRLLIDCIENLLSEVDFEFGGWGDESILAESEPDHYVVQARSLVANIRIQQEAHDGEEG